MNTWVRQLPVSKLFTGYSKFFSFSKLSLKKDLIAGITVSLVAIPQSLAYAQLAGVPAYYGLYAALIPTIIAALFGSSRQLSTGLEYEGMGKLPPGVMVYAIEGPFFFGAVENFERALAQTHSDPHTLLIRLRRVPFMDITGLQTLEKAIEHMKKRGVTIMLSEANDRGRARLIKTGILKLIGEQHYFKSFTAAISHCGGVISMPAKNLMNQARMKQPHCLLLPTCISSIISIDSIFLITH